METRRGCGRRGGCLRQFGLPVELPHQVLAVSPQAFDPAHLGRASAHFDASQLRVWQKESVKHMSGEQVAQWLAPQLPADLDTVRIGQSEIQQNYVKVKKDVVAALPAPASTS